MPYGRTILLFTRAPEAEARAKRLPLAEGTRLFAGFVQGWQQQADEAQANLLVVTPPSSEAALQRLLPHASVAIQSGESFAARIEAAFTLAFDRGAGAVLMVGGDGPPLKTPDIHDAFAHLESHPRAFVLAPCDDGGVNAIGFSVRAERPLSEITWQSPDVCRHLMSEGARCGLALLLISSGHDLDCAGSVAALYRVSRKESAWRAFRWLLLSLLLVCRAIAVVISDVIAQFSAGSHTTRGPPLSCLA